MSQGPFDFNWLQRSLNGRHAVETLLAPERDAGNVSPNDYEAAVKFAAGPQRSYSFLGSLLGVPFTFAFRKPSWSFMRSSTFFAASSMGGIFVGGALTILAYVKFLNSLENPLGFRRAIENIKSRESPAILRSDSNWALDTDPAPTDTEPSSSTNHVEKPSINPTSKWEQIRVATARPSTNSAWDTLRQNHEKTRVSSMSSDPDPDAFHRSRSQDRVAEQARFNDMLERERNIKHDS